jgi:hypothetical protein
LSDQPRARRVCWNPRFSRASVPAVWPVPWPRR